jgi:sensor histidine kinase YesM
VTSTTRAAGPIRAWFTVFLAWTLVGLFYLSQDVARRYFFGDARPWREASYWMVRVYVSAAFTPLILWLGRRYPIERPKRFVRVVQHLLAGSSFALAEVAIETAVLLRVGDLAALSLYGSYRRSASILLIFGFHANLLSYLVILGIQSGIRYYRRYQEHEQHALRLELHASELKARLADAQLSALKAQLQPHFLFNTLNAIMVLIRQQRGPEAEDTLARVSDLLRAVLTDMDAQEVPLWREVEFLRLYLSIEQVRFPDRLRVEIDVDPEVMDAAVPHMGLQPIVENAVRHGIGKSAAAGLIGIHASRTNGQLKIMVVDDGPGMPGDAGSTPKGIGLANTRARLSQLYGDRASLSIASGDRGGVAVTVSLPFRVAPDLRPREAE